jgi:hypothetical protein
LVTFSKNVLFILVFKGYKDFAHRYFLNFS